MMRVFVVFLALLLTACESNPPAPVLDRAPQATQPKPPTPTTSKPSDIKPANGKDWRPDSHAVKKGETLFGIGLEYGLDYKEIAAANNISEPYTIKIGQTLNLASLKAKSTTAEAIKTETKPADDGVVITPMQTEPDVLDGKPVAETTPLPTPIPSVVTPVLTTPRATREAYSVDAWKRTTPIKAPEPIKTAAVKPAEAKPNEIKPAEVKPVGAKPAETKPAEAKPTEIKSADDESVAWAWPTQGKVSARFNEASNKGVDIAGATGQAINAASSGKVIYSGSDLRGYGKLVIIKHNKTYLSVYAHNSKIVVKEGQVVVAGQKIAEMGNTDANSVKLHFEIRRLGKSVDPAKYLNQN
jgi:lipoprotein NlpD